MTAVDLTTDRGESLRDEVTRRRGAETAGETCHVRVLVRVGHNPTGEGGPLTYAAVGCGVSEGHDDQDELRETVDTLSDDKWVDGGRYTWVEASVPAPRDADTVKGDIAP